MPAATPERFRGSKRENSYREILSSLVPRGAREKGAAPAPNPQSTIRNLQFIALVTLLAAFLAVTPGCALRQAYPETQIRGYINGQPFSVNAPKDSTLAGFDAIAETNGAIHVHIDSLQSSLNPTNLANAAAGQAAIVTATASAMNAAMQNAATIALKAAAAAP